MKIRLLLNVMVVANVFFVGCSPLGSAYLGTEIGHHYNTNITPVPQIAIDSITFYPPITNYYWDSVNQASLEGKMIGKGIKTGEIFGESKKLDESLSINVDSSFLGKKIIRDINRTAKLSNITTESLEKLKFNGKKAYVMSFLEAIEQKTFLDSQLNATVRHVEEYSKFNKAPRIINRFSGYGELVKSVHTKYLGLITIIQVRKSVIDSVKREDIVNENSIQLRLLILNKYNDSLIACKSLTLYYAFGNDWHDYNDLTKPNDPKRIRFCALAIKELLKNCFNENNIEIIGGNKNKKY